VIRTSVKQNEISYIEIRKQVYLIFRRVSLLNRYRLEFDIIRSNCKPCIQNWILWHPPIPGSFS